MTTSTPSRKKPVYHDGGWHDAAVHDRLALPADTVLAGPAIVEQPDTTVWVPPGWEARVAALGCLHLTRAEQAAVL